MPDERGSNLQRQEAETRTVDPPAAHRIADDIRDRMSSLRPQAADGMQHAADAARQAASGLTGEDAWMAQLIEQGATKLSGLADTLRTNDLQSLLGKAEQFARRQPVLFAGAAMALGFALTRAAAVATRGPAARPQPMSQDF